ncbi:MAG: LysM peptidoglycan-binding domain-containing protein [Thermodesulfobacteriota bacterium]|nr:MAG: LysM peptidoglycan-binding domain-containing protein [Thermodesulfobacteriota bacterium]
MYSKRFAIKLGCSALVLSIPLLYGGGLIAGEAGKTAGAEAGESAYHKIVPRDTLWDISGKYLEDPFKWPGLWKINPYIKNPHLIYPGNIVRITPEGIEVLSPDQRAEGLYRVELSEDGEQVVVLEPEEADAQSEALSEAPAEKVDTAEKAADQGPRVKDKAMARGGFISEAELKGSGAIVKQEEGKLFMSEGDKVYVSFGDASDVKAGDRFTVFMEGKKIRHPDTRKKMGSEVEVIGSLRITRAEAPAEGVVERSFREIPLKARLKPYTRPVVEVALTETDAEVNGHIVTALEARENLSEGDIAYIDKGSADGIKAGNIMRIFRPVPEELDPMARKKKKVSIPPLELGTLVILEAGQATSTGVVLKSQRPIVWGDKVSTVSTQ